MYDAEYELKELIQLSERFIDYITDLHEKKEINTQQYELLIQKKLRFINWAERKKHTSLQNL